MEGRKTSLVREVKGVCLWGTHMGRKGGVSMISKRMNTSRDIVFHENVFPYATSDDPTSCKKKDSHQ
ncbi:Retrovirus-related Pol polyprotein from transposon TNT 1-94, partial [Sesbania bispinosa]